MLSALADNADKAAFALGVLGGSFPSFASGADKVTNSGGDVVETIRGINDATVGALPIIGTGEKAILDWGQALVDSAGSADTAASAFDKGTSSINGSVGPTRSAASATNSLAHAAGRAAGKEGLLKKSAQDVRAAYKDMRSAIRDAADALNQQKRGHEETNIKIKQTKMDLHDARKELKKLQEIKDPTRDQRKSMLDLQLQILEDQDELTTLRADLDASGKVNMSVTKSWIDKLKDGLGEAGDKAFYLHQQLRDIADASGSGYTNTGGSKGTSGGKKKGGGSSGGGGGSSVTVPHSAYTGFHAMGGVIPAGSYGYAGEAGVERLNALPGGGVQITPLGGGSTPSLVVNINGVTVMTPGAAEALAQQVGPIVTRWQQRSGMLPRVAGR